jgi:flagellar hook protein FlgE
MSLSGAMGSAVSALQAQSSALSIISYNIANASTTGFKASSASFASLLTSSGASGDVSGGVAASARANVTAYGLTETTSSATDLALSGDGFFVVSTGTDAAQTYYTRAGSFEIDDDGYLTSNGYYLTGWPTDAAGTIVGSTAQSNLTAIDTDALSVYAAATTTIGLKGSLPSNAATDATFETELTLYDSLGATASATATWTKTGTYTWTLSVADPTDSDGNTIGTVTSDPITVTFNDDGSLASTDPSPATLTVAGWSSGAAESSITLDLGTAGKSNGVTQLSDNDGTLSVAMAPTQDGYAAGALTGISVEADGTVMASYDNGAEIAIFKIAVATFANANGLTEKSGSIYAASQASGAVTLHVAGSDGAGTIQNYTLEQSTTDTNTEFSNMIAAQQAYSAASQVMSTVSDMFDTLMQAVR